MADRDTIWPLRPHTEGKHLVLRGYLNAWLPIMGTWNGRILFIDGFAGPGEYSGGEPGSPIIALRAMQEHRAKETITAEVVFIFIESDPERVEHLDSLVAGIESEIPANCRVEVVEGKFDRSMTKVLDQLAEQGSNLAPALVMADPFGVSDTPMEVISRILDNDRCEVLISFQYESISRFMSTPEFRNHLDDLFGTDEWRPALEMEGDEKRDFLFNLYERCLRNAGAEQVVRFDLYRKSHLVYSIFFGTQHHTGSDRMKAAIWSVAPGGDFSFRGTRSQLTLGVEEPDYGVLRQALCDRFNGEGLVTIEEVIEFVSSDQTDFHKGQLKTPVLKPMEDEGLLTADEDSRNYRGTYPDGTRIRFQC